MSDFLTDLWHGLIDFYQQVWYWVGDWYFLAAMFAVLFGLAVIVRELSHRDETE